MKRFCLVLGAIVTICLLFSCGQKTTGAAKVEAGKGAPGTPEATFTNEKAGHCTVQDLALYDLTTDGKLKWKESLLLGERVQITGQKAKATEGQYEKDFILVKRDSGKEGWARADLVIPKSGLGVAIQEKAVVYSQPKNTAATSRYIPKLAIVAVHADGITDAFYKITGWDAINKIFHSEVYVRKEDLSIKNDDVQSVILFTVASLAKEQTRKEALLNSAKKDYPSSQFITQIEDALAALSAPQIAVEVFSGNLIVNADNVSVMDVPDEKKGQVLGYRMKGNTVTVGKKTKDSYTVGEVNAPWYLITDPEPTGWIFGGFLESEQ